MPDYSVSAVSRAGAEQKTCKWAGRAGRPCVRAPARRAGAYGRLPEYCEQADGPGEPAHNAENAWRLKNRAAKAERPPQHPMTLREACALVTGILGQPTAREVHQFLAADNWEVTLGTVKQTLNAIRGGPVDVTARRGPRAAARWRLTEAGSAWTAADW